MKNIVVLCASFAAVGICYAQNTPWPASGNVGIGTTTPGAKLTIKGDGATDPLQLSDGVRSFRVGPSVGVVQGFNIYDDNAAAVRVRIDNSGNVGIGTIFPRSRLDLGGQLGAGQGARFGDYLEINEREYINNASSIGWNAYIASNDGTFVPTYAPGTGMVLSMASGGDADLDFWGKNWAGDASPKDLGSFTHVMRLCTNGNVGIGTTTPVGKLELASNASVDNAFVLSSLRGFSGNRNWRLSLDQNAEGQFEITPSTIKGGNTYSNTALAITSAGNVGIGTTSPTEKLSVNGRIRAKEVIVDTNWSDYVFAKGYLLASLSEVEQHIQTQGHLPGVPSAQEVAEKGVSVGDMQAVLLAKIEELTLHQIAQEKHQFEQEKELTALRTKVTNLEAENARLKP
jgi:hypothetical protein